MPSPWSIFFYYWLCLVCGFEVVAGLLIELNNQYTPMWAGTTIHNHDSTASRLLSAVKHGMARLVLRWVTTLEFLVLFFYQSSFALGR